MTDHPDAPLQLLGWTVVLVPRLGDLARAYLPGATLDARRREHLLVEVAGALGCESLEDAHRGWYGLLGPAELTDDDDDLVAWAAQVVRLGPGAITEAAPDGVGDDLAGLVRALVAHAGAATASVHAAESILDRLRTRPGRQWASLPGHLAAAAAGGVLALPVTLGGALFEVLGRLVPTAPTIAVEPDPNLMAQLLAEVLPTWLGSPLGRTLVAALPVRVPVAVSAGASGATVWVGQGQVVVTNGLDEGAWAAFDGDVDALVRAGSQSLNRELRAVRSAH